MRQALRHDEASVMLRRLRAIDIRSVLASIDVPTLVMQREGFRGVPPVAGRSLSEQIPGARLALVPGNDGSLATEPSGEILGHIQQFLPDVPSPIESGRALASILFTDIVGSTLKASALGDKQWRRLLEEHERVSLEVVDLYGGQLIKSTGDGLLATFDGPGRAIRCAIALADDLRPLGIEVRSGLHTGEIELIGADIAGIGVHIAARVLEKAQAGELWVSAAVPMLVAGSTFEFEDRGEHELKGISGTWRLFTARTE